MRVLATARLDEVQYSNAVKMLGLHTNNITEHNARHMAFVVGADFLEIVESDPELKTVADLYHRADDDYLGRVHGVRVYSDNVLVKFGQQRLQPDLIAVVEGIA